MKTVVTITGIRPDFIRMSELFKKLDENFNHILIHSGQHFDKLLSGIFFKELKIRKPDFNLKIGGKGKEHYHQVSELSIKIIELLKKKKIKPDIILFLGDSNSVACSVALKKEGYKIGHIEAGMRSGDRRMLEEINRTVCDHCSDMHFCYHKNYKNNLIKENLPAKNIYIVGNTINGTCLNNFDLRNKIKDENFILVDIHRPENFKCKIRMSNIIHLVRFCSDQFGVVPYMLNFPRTMEYIKKFKINLNGINVVDLFSYRGFLKKQYHAKLIISDSGTAQEEPALLSTPVIVPRDFTERPESVENNCSLMVNVNSKRNTSWRRIKKFIDFGFKKNNTKWLGTKNASQKIINVLKKKL